MDWKSVICKWRRRVRKKVRNLLPGKRVRPASEKSNRVSWFRSICSRRVLFICALYLSSRFRDKRLRGFCMSLFSCCLLRAWGSRCVRFCGHRSAAAVPDTGHFPYPFSGEFDSSRFQFFLIVRAAMGIIRCCRASAIRMIGPKRSPHRRSTRLFVRSWIGRSQGKRRRRRLCPDFLQIKFFIIILFL